MSSTSHETPDEIHDVSVRGRDQPGEVVSADEESSTSKAEHSTSAGSRLPPIVGVGASAGGLESLEKLFRALPARTAVVTSRISENVRVVTVLPEEPVPLLGDPTRLEQVFTNLLNNAVRHSPVGAKVVVSVEVCGTRVRATVTDEGDGIAPDQLQGIFELFGRSRDAATRSSGLGLGLGIARRIVAGHDGRIHAESEGLMRSARFIIDLPLYEAPAAPLASTDRSRARVVLIEDQEDACDMARSLLQMRGHEVIVAMSGSAGISGILQHQPDLALVDISLPDIDGYAVVREVHARLGRSIPLIALTGLGQPEDIKRSHEAGFARHLTKPFDIENLDQVIQEFRARRQGVM